MKTIHFLTLAVISILTFSSLKPASATSDDNGYYFFIVVDGTWKNDVGYASRIIYYPGYRSCNKLESTDFLPYVRSAFSDHLKAYHTEAFPNGENNNFKTIDMKKHSTSDLLMTRAQAEQRLTEWIAEQKGKGYKVQTTNFSYSCDNL